MSTPGREEPYKISCAGVEREKIRELALEATEQGFGVEFLEVLTEVCERLTTEPLTWGDPLYWLHHMDVMVFRGMLSFLQVHYAVDQVRGIVYVQQVDLMPWHPRSHSE